MPIVAIEHVQLAIPAGMEQAAREFYEGLLGIPEVPKPPELAKRGGAWFERGSLEVHLGVEADFRPARKAHPALLVIGLEALVDRLKQHNAPQVDGTGEIRMESAERASGYFTTRADSDPNVNARTAGVYLRAEPEDLSILDGRDDRKRAELIAERLRHWKSLKNA